MDRRAIDQFLIYPDASTAAAIVEDVDVELAPADVAAVLVDALHTYIGPG